MKILNTSIVKLLFDTEAAEVDIKVDYFNGQMKYVIINAADRDNPDNSVALTPEQFRVFIGLFNEVVSVTNKPPLGCEPL